MEKVLSPQLYTRRETIGVLLGGVAALSQVESSNPSSGIVTNGGGMLCVTAPNEAGIQELESIHENALDSEQYTDRFKIAERYNLTVVPRGELADFIDQELSKSRSPQEAVELSNNFIEYWFGIQLSLDTEILEAESRQIISDTTELVQKLSFLLRNISLLPVELYEAIKFSSITIKDLPSGTGGDYDPSLGRIRLDPTQISNENTYFHEIGHAVHITGCGNYEDEAIISTLPDGLEYTGKGDNHAVSDGIFAEPYGQKSYFEDAATIIEAWITGRIGLSEEGQGTPQYEKLAIMMDRFDTLLPGIVQYIEEGVRPIFLRRT